LKEDIVSICSNERSIVVVTSGGQVGSIDLPKPDVNDKPNKKRKVAKPTNYMLPVLIEAKDTYFGVQVCNTLM
jgi:hypothetical protein